MHYKLNQENILLRKLHIRKITYKHGTDPSFLNLEFQKFHDLLHLQLQAFHIQGLHIHKFNQT